MPAPQRTLFFAAICLWLACCAADPETEPLEPIRVSGHAFAFTLPGQDYGRIAGATITVVEMPDQGTVTSADGAFAFPALPPGQDATFVMTAPGFPVGQTRTFTLPDKDLDKVTFQIPANSLYKTLEGVVGLTSDSSKCHMVSTITVVGKSLYDAGAHGVAGATVSANPTPVAQVGPVYFNSAVIPDQSRKESSDDGGVLWGNVEPGEYRITATKPGATFASIRMKCRPGVLVNASPPYGLQALPTSGEKQ